MFLLLVFRRNVEEEEGAVGLIVSYIVCSIGAHSSFVFYSICACAENLCMYPKMTSQCLWYAQVLLCCHSFVLLLEVVRDLYDLSRCVLVQVPLLHS